MRRLWESQGLQVSRLIRIRYGPVELPRRFVPDIFRTLQQEEVKALYATVKLDAPEPARPKRRRRTRRRRSR